MRRLAPALALLAAALIAAPAACAASTAAFGSPQVLATQGWHAVASIGPGGDVVVAWAGIGGGVFVARRDALGGAYSSPLRLSDDRVGLFGSVRLARNDHGDIAVAWLREYAAQDSPAVVRVAVAAAGARSFAAAQDVQSGEALGDFALAVAGDGTVAVTVGTGRPPAALYVSQRPPNGTFSTPQLLDDGLIGGGAPVVAGPDGTLHAIWLTDTNAQAGVPRSSAVLVAEARPGTGWGPPRRLSDPAFTAGQHPNLTPQLVVNRRGELLAAWADGPPDHSYATRAEISVRRAGGEWSAPTELAGPLKSVRSVSPAINDAGDASVVWGGVSHIETAFRPAGASFGSPWNTQSPVSTDVEAMTTGIDALGVTLIVHRVFASGSTDGPGRIVALLRPRDRAPQPDVPISAVETAIQEPSLATDPFGNGVVVWTSHGQPRPVTAVAYSALAPLVEGVRAGSRELRFRVSEPAKLRITVRRDVRRGKSASQTAVARAGANKVRYGSRMRALLRKRGRYVATIRSRDAGPRSATIKVRFRRR